MFVSSRLCLLNVRSFPGCVPSGLNLFRVRSLPGCGCSGLCLSGLCPSGLNLFRVNSLPCCGSSGLCLSGLCPSGLWVSGLCHSGLCPSTHFSTAKNNNIITLGLELEKLLKKSYEKAIFHMVKIEISSIFIFFIFSASKTPYSF